MQHKKESARPLERPNAQPPKGVTTGAIDTSILHRIAKKVQYRDLAEKFLDFAAAFFFILAAFLVGWLLIALLDAWAQNHLGSLVLFGWTALAAIIAFNTKWRYGK